jgi:hypothetical protein
VTRDPAGLLVSVSGLRFRACSLLVIAAMSGTTYRVLAVIAGVVGLADACILGLILTWLIGAGGVIACGKGVFDSPDWPLTLIILVGLPAAILLGAISIIRTSFRRAALHNGPQ